MAEETHNSELQAETSPQAQMTPRQIIFESCTSPCWHAAPESTQHSFFIFMSLPLSSTASSWYTRLWASPGPTFCKNPSIQLIFSSKICNFLLNLLCFILQLRPQKWPTWFVQAATTCPSWGCPLPTCHRGFSLHIPGALLYSKLSCSVTLVQ